MSSTTTLRATYGALVEAKRAGDEARFAALLQAIHPPHPEALFARLFGEAAPAMCENHAALVPLRDALFTAVFTDAASVDHEIDTHVHTVKEMREQDIMVHRLRPFRSLAPDATFGFVVHPQILLPFWVFDEGAWRYLGDLALLAPEEPTAKGLERRLFLVGELRESPEGAFVTGTLALPDHATWFAETFGAALAGPLIAEYEEWLANGVLQEISDLVLERVFQSEQARDKGIEAEGYLSPYSQRANGTQRAALAAMRRPLPLYTAALPDGYILSSFVFVDGHWRWLGKLQALAESPQWQPAASYAADAAGLARLLLDCTHRAATETRHDWATLCLPDAEAWLAARIGADAAKVVAPRQHTPERVAELFTQIAAAECFLVETAPLASDPRATTSQKLWQSLASGDAYGAHHSGPSAALTSSWTHVDGAWRLLFLPALELLPAWRTFLSYPWPEDPDAARFPPSSSGLSALLHELARSARDDRGLFWYLFNSLVAKAPEPAWFAPLLETDAQRADAARALAEHASDAVEVLEPRFAAAGHRGPHEFVVIPTTKWADIYVVLWRAPWEDTPERCLQPLAFRDGAWRLLDTRLGWTEEL